MSLSLALASKLTSAGTPYTEGTGLICRVPSIGLILYTCIQYYETLMWPAAAAVHPELLATTGPLVSGDPLVAVGLVASGVILGTGYIMFGIWTLRTGAYPSWPAWFLVIGAPLFGVGILFPVRTIGLILYCVGTIWLASDLRKLKV